jgi:UDP-N-acetylmuramoylalanine--D-glutamate ligase
MALRGEVGACVARGGTALIVGYGRSGRAAHALLAREGMSCRAADAHADELAAQGAAEPETGAPPEWYSDGDVAALDGVALVVKSPGVPRGHALVRGAEARGIRIVGELELGWASAVAPLCSITGSNGKSTVTALLAHMLATDGRESAAAGNIGQALSAVAPRIGPSGAIAVEVSSFQIEDLLEYRTRGAVLLNVTPDHLDRHGNFEEYRRAKARLLELVEPDGFRIVNADDPESRSIVERWRRDDPERTLVFSLAPFDGRGAFLDGNRLMLRLDQAAPIANVGEMTITGPHNVQNALAAALAAVGHGVDASALATALRTFRPLRHRLERVARAGGVLFVNDSKATNLDSLRMALLSYPEGVVLIAGGRDKGSPFETLADLVRQRVRHLVLIGEAASRIRTAWPDVPATEAAGITEAVRLAYAAARPSGVVLLSPGCASFDMFKNFEDRGDRFADAVRGFLGELRRA